MLQQAVRVQESRGDGGHTFSVDHDSPHEFGHPLRGKSSAHFIEQPPNLFVQPLRTDHGGDVLRVLQVPVVHANIAPAWEIMKRLRVREPRSGFGRLLRELPEMA